MDEERSPIGLTGAAETVRLVDRLEGRTRLALRSDWSIPALWAALSLGSIIWALPGIGPARLYVGVEPIAPDLMERLAFGGFYGRLMDYWTLATPVGIAGSVVLHRRRALKPILPRPSLWHLPLIAALVLFVPIAALAFGDPLHPQDGPAGWFPLVALATLIAGWVTRVRLLSVGSAVLLVFSVYLYQWGYAFMGLLPVAFVAGYALIALGLRMQAARR